MSTPITDAAWKDYIRRGVAGETLASPMMRLETDRAALMEALEGIVSAGGNYCDLLNARDNSRAALSAARANFPTP